MKNAKLLTCKNEKQASLRQFDLREIDNEDKYAFSRLHYLERIRKIIKAVERYCPGKKILELGSAQSNMSLLLAEKGFSSIALDINIEFLKYSQSKYETGKVAWICANAMDLPFQKESLDGVIIAELLEHCAYPEKIVEGACNCLKQEGFLIITTPNADCVINREAKFSRMKIDRFSLQKREFGPAGEAHLFALSLKHILSVLPDNFKILGTSYLNSILLNSHTYFLYRRLTLRLLKRLQMVASALPLLNIKLCNSIMVYSQKRKTCHPPASGPIEKKRISKKNGMESLVSIIVANYNGAHLLPECLSSLREQDYPHIEITVVDNGSIDKSSRVTKNYGARFIELGHNYGLSVAYNRGAQTSSGNYLFFVNNDMRFERDCVSKLVQVIRGRDNSIFAVDPLQYNWEGNKIIHYQGVFVRISSLKSVFSEMFFPLPPLIKTYVPSQEIAEIPWGCAGSLMVKKDMFEELGGFDKTFFIDLEDTDLCWRAWLRGWRTLFVPQAKLYHKWGASLDEGSSKKSNELRENLPRLVFQRIVSQQKNYQRFALKVLDPTSILLIFSLKLVSVLLYSVSSKTLIAKGILRAFFLTLKGLPDALKERKRIGQTTVMSNCQIIARFCNDKTPTALIWPVPGVLREKKKNQ